MGKIMVRLIAHPWDNLMCVSKVKSSMGNLFVMGRGVTQGDPASPMIFNIVVDAVVRATLEVFCGPQEARHGVGWVAGKHNLIFCMDNRRIGGRDHIWVQYALTVSVAMFRRMVLGKNLDKTKALVCTPRYIWGECIEVAYKCRSTRDVETFGERKQARLSFKICGVTVAASSLRGHMVRQHGNITMQTIEVEIGG